MSILIFDIFCLHNRERLTLFLCINKHSFIDKLIGYLGTLRTPLTHSTLSDVDGAVGGNRRQEDKVHGLRGVQAQLHRRDARDLHVLRENGYYYIGELQ